jgi:hypothetical protein
MDAVMEGGEGTARAIWFDSIYFGEREGADWRAGVPGEAAEEAQRRGAWRRRRRGVRPAEIEVQVGAAAARISNRVVYLLAVRRKLNLASVRGRLFARFLTVPTWSPPP